MLYVQLVILGLPIAGLFALLATGVVMVYRASRVLNLAVGGVAMFTAYVLYWCTNDPGGPGLPVAIGLVLALAFAGATGWALERFLLRPIEGRPVLTSVIMTIAALALLTGVAGAIWGFDRRDAPRVVPDGGSVTIAGATVGLDRMAVLAITAVLMAAVIWLFRRTKTGIAMRAVSDDRSSALLMGIPAGRMSSLTWIGGSLLAGTAGILLSPIIGLQPVNLTLLAIPAYAAALFGGLTSLPRTLGGAAIVGIAYSVVPSLPGIASSDLPGTREIVIFLAVIVFMFVAHDRFADTAEGI